MSTTDVATVDHARGNEIEQLSVFQRNMRRLDAMATELARASFAPKTITQLKGKVRPFEDVKADVKALLLTADSLAIPIGINIFKQFSVIQGEAVPSTNTLTGIADSHGIEVYPDDDCDDEVAIVHVRRPEWPLDYTRSAKYTIDQAARTGALDVWFERWENGQFVEKVVVGQTLDEAAWSTPRPSWAGRREPKCNPTWHHYREDMLIWRCTRRALRRHAPKVASLLVGFSDAPVMGYRETPAGPVPVIDRDPDTGQPIEDDEITDAEIVEQTAPNAAASGESGPTVTPHTADAAGERTVDPGGGEPGASAVGAASPTRPNPYASAIHIAGHDAGLTDGELDDIIRYVTGDASANGVTRENKDQVLALIIERAEAKGGEA
jgi:hypothetical protein